MKRFHSTCLSLGAAATLLLCLPACNDDGGGGETNETGDGDGDGDGDPATGDGDGDPTTGDGDGDPTTGDGDGDPTTGDGDGDGDLSFEADIYPIIMANCSCHVGGQSGGLAMPDAATAFGNLVSVPSVHDPNINRIEPGDAAASYLYQKITATQAGLGPGNVQMPNTGTTMSNNPLSDADQMLISDWITAGAAP